MARICNKTTVVFTRYHYYKYFSIRHNTQDCSQNSQKHEMDQFSTNRNMPVFQLKEKIK